MVPVNEEYVRRMAEKLSVKPVNDYRHGQVIEEILKKRVAVMQLSLTESPVKQNPDFDF
ncbi:MAG: hypothetical protein AAF655_17250 [Bacteroidota bacterium]